MSFPPAPPGEPPALNNSDRGEFSSITNEKSQMLKPAAAADQPRGGLVSDSNRVESGTNRVE
jgi:hypothetical protein